MSNYSDSEREEKKEKIFSGYRNPIGGLRVVTYVVIHHVAPRVILLAVPLVVDD